MPMLLNLLFLLFFALTCVWSYLLRQKEKQLDSHYRYLYEDERKGKQMIVAAVARTISEYGSPNSATVDREGLKNAADLAIMEADQTSKTAGLPRNL